MSVIFGTYDSLDDFHLHYTHREIGVPAPKLNLVDIPLRNGSLDLTAQLSSNRAYERRTLKLGFEFIGSRSSWRAWMQDIMYAIHGKNLTVQLPEYSTYMFRGICEVGALQDNGASATVEITVNAEPYLIAKNTTTTDTYTISGETEVTVTVNNARGVDLTFVTSAQITVELNGDTDTLPQGTSTSFFELEPGANVFTFDGSGTVSMTYRRAVL